MPGSGPMSQRIASPAAVAAASKSSIGVRFPSRSARFGTERGSAPSPRTIAWARFGLMERRVSALRIPNQRAVIDRRQLAAAVAEAVAEQGPQKARPRIVALLREALEAGRAELTTRLAAHPSAGHEITHGHAFLIDQLIRVIHDHVFADLLPAEKLGKTERLTLIAVGGYGRGEMAPHSDVDIAFITPGRTPPQCEQAIEAMLYYLWDLGIKVGHSSRSLDEMVKMA